MVRASKRQRQQRIRWYIAALVVAAAAITCVAYLALSGGHKPIIMYINQGNGAVNGSGFDNMLTFASQRGFNTIFFQAYREGRLLDSPATLASFVNETHRAGLQIYFALYITNDSQSLPSQIFALHEDGVSLDMVNPTVDPASQHAFLASLASGFRGKTAVTTTDFATTLKPDLLILETYAPETKGYIRNGMVGSVGVFETISLQDYQSQFQYALSNSDGVMVFDYAGLLKAGY